MIELVEYFHDKIDKKLKIIPRYDMWSCKDCD